MSQTERVARYTSGAVPPGCFFETVAYQNARRRVFDRYPMNTAILGEVRSGKSSTLDALLRYAHDLESSRFDIAPLSLAEAKLEFGADGPGLLRGLATAVALAWPGTDENRHTLEQGIRASQTTPTLKRLLVQCSRARLAEAGRYTLVAAEDYDQVMSFSLCSEDFGLLRELLERPFDNGLVSLVTARRNLREIEEACGSVGSKFWTLYGSPPTHLGLLSDEEAARFMERFGTESLGPSHAKALFRLVGKHPAALMLALEALSSCDRIDPLELLPEPVEKAVDGPLRSLREGQFDLYQHWKLRLGDSGPHRDHWTLLRRLANSAIAQDSEDAIHRLQGWGYIEFDRSRDLESVDYVYAYRPFSMLFDRYLRREAAGPASLFEQIGAVERALRDVVSCVVEYRLKSSVDAWLGQYHADLLKRLASCALEDRVSIPEHGVLEYALLGELLPVFLSEDLWGHYPDSLRQGGKSRWQTELERLRLLRNPVAHYRVLKTSAANVLTDICDRRCAQLTAAVEDLRRLRT